MADDLADLRLLAMDQMLVLRELIAAVQGLAGSILVPAPQVNYLPPDIHIPAPVVHVEPQTRLDDATSHVTPDQLAQTLDIVREGLVAIERKIGQAPATTIRGGGISQDALRQAVSDGVGVAGLLTNTQLRATPVPVSGTITSTTGLTNDQLRATPVPVSGAVALDSPSLLALEKVSIVNAGTTTANVSPYGALDTYIGSSTLFYDSWSTPVIDTTDRWQITGTTPTIVNGQLVHPSTVGYHTLRSRDIIKPNSGFTEVRNGVTIEAVAAQGAGRFWGLGTNATVPSATSLIQEGAGFEIDSATGNLLAVTYVGGVRTTIATLTRPTDGGVHRYALFFRVTQAFWFIDGIVTAVAAVTFPNVQNAELPAILVRNNEAAFTGTPVYMNIAHLTADTSKSGSTIIDSVVGTRSAKVTDPNSYAAPPVVSGQGFGAALNVNPNAIQKRTYVISRVTANAAAPASVATTANTRAPLLQIHHLASSTITRRIRRISVGALAGPSPTAVQLSYELFRVTSAPTGGSALTPTALDANEAAASVVATYLPTTSGTVVGDCIAFAQVSAGGTGHATIVVYDWQESGMSKPPVMHAGQLEGYCLFVRGNSLTGPDPQILVEYTAE